MSELERFQLNNEQGLAPGLWLTLHINLGEKPDEAANKFLSVINSWIKAVEELESTKKAWPTDEQWEQLLPPWFIETFKGYTVQEIHDSGWRWDYGSWLDSMRDRVWQWWGYWRDDGSLTVQLQLASWPYSMGPLEYLAKVAGGQLTIIEDKEQ
jgi:hypothetical protein